MIFKPVHTLWTVSEPFFDNTLAVADPGFPRGGGTNHQGGGANLLFGQNFPENCMKIKEFRPRGARPWRPPLEPPMFSMRKGEVMIKVIAGVSVTNVQLNFLCHEFSCHVRDTLF